MSRRNAALAIVIAVSIAPLILPVSTNADDNVTNGSTNTLTPTPEPSRLNHLDTIRQQKTQLLQDRQATISAKRDQLQAKISEAKQRIEEKRDEMLQNAKDRFLKHIDRIIEHLNNLKSRVSSSEGIDTNTKATAIAEIDNMISRLNSLKGKVSSAESREDFKGVGEEIRSVWHEIRAKRKKHAGLVVAGRFTRFLNRMEEVASKVEAHLATLSEQGVEVSGAQAALGEFKTSIGSAKSTIDDAVVVFNAITANNLADGNYNQAMNSLRTAKQELHEAGKSLREAIQEVKVALRTASDNSAPAQP